MAVTFAALAYFTTRLIDQNDKQHDKTRGRINLLSEDVRELREKLKGIESTYEGLRANGRFNGASAPEEIQAIKRKVSSAILGIHQVQKDIDKILPQVENNQKNYGEIIWIKDEVSNQNKKLKVMFDVMAKLVEKNQKH